MDHEGIEDIRCLTAKKRMNYVNDHVNSFKFDNATPLLRYLNSCKQLIKLADDHYDLQKFECAYILYVKYITLFVEKFPEHPEYHRFRSHEAWVTIKSEIKRIMERAEELKQTLQTIYDEEHRIYLEEEKQRQELLLQQKVKLQNKKTVAGSSEFSEKMFSSNDPLKSLPMLPDDFLRYDYPNDRSPPPYREEYSKPSTVSKPTVNRSVKPSSFTYHSAIRKIIVPYKMLNKFLILSQENTDNNVETCGVLAGKLEKNKLRITHLLIPKQHGCSDSCTTENEEEFFNYQDKHDLITLGWIHTHPSQTAFLSSVDLHTHYSYQLMISEAVAIVCAPRYYETGFFHLTPNYGLEYIANCKQSGFHPHPSEPPLFQNADHCEVDDNAVFEVVDLRK